MPSEDKTVFQQMVSGVVAAFAELPVGHPLMNMKIRHQGGLPVTFNPRILYQGFWFYAGSMVPIAATQTTAKHVFKNVLFANSPTKAPWQDVVCAYAAGAFAAIFASPVEMVITNMKDNRKFVATARYIFNQGGMKHLYSGLMMTAMRDGWFGVGYMAAPAVFKPVLLNYVHNEKQADVASKVASGVVASVGSQVFDTVKTVQQLADKGMRFFDAAKKPYVTQGVRGYFNGGLYRATRVVPAVFVMSTAMEYVETFFTQGSEATESSQNDRTRGFPSSRHS